MNRFSPAWIVKCRIKLDLWLNSFEHIAHLNCSPEWIFKCEFKLLNCFEHIVHFEEFSPVWFFKCVFKKCFDGRTVSNILDIWTVFLQCEFLSVSLNYIFRKTVLNILRTWMVFLHCAFLNVFSNRIYCKTFLNIFHIWKCEFLDVHLNFF